MQHEQAATRRRSSGGGERLDAALADLSIEGGLNTPLHEHIADAVHYETLRDGLDRLYLRWSIDLTLGHRCHLIAPAAGAILRSGPCTERVMNLLDHEFPAIDGGTIRLRDHAGGPILVVNTASECDTTPQYRGLQRLHERYADAGLAVIGVPSNDFGEQEPGDEAEVRAFCTRAYGVSFPLTARQRVVPPDEHPFYRDIAAELGDVGRPQWNFHKYLLGPDGDLAGLWDSQTDPLSGEIIEAIEAALPEGGGA